MFKRWTLSSLLMIALVVPVVAKAAHPPQSGYLTSWDGVKIYYTLFMPEGASNEAPVPAILMTHGWGGTGQTTKSGTLAKLVDQGYAVLTWDQRGFGRSGGQVEIDHPDVEGRDVSRLIDFLSYRSDIANDPFECPPPPPGGGPVGCKYVRDPSIGMSGGSYAGGIQLATAAFDSRIDAIAPEIAWNDLPGSLFPQDVPKVGWDTLLYGTGQSAVANGLPYGETGNYNPKIHESYTVVSATNDPTPYESFFDERSPRHYVDGITAPTFIIQGSIDTLFTLNQGIANFTQISDNLDEAGQPVPTKMMFYNAGHTLGSAVPAGSGADNARTRADNALVAWFDRYVKGLAVDTGPKFEYQDNFASWHSASSFPVGSPVSASGTASVVSTVAPTGGGTLTAGNPNYSGLSSRIPVFTDTSDRKIVGITRITGTATVTGVDGFVFFKLVNTTTGDVLDDQVTPLRVKGPGVVNIALDLEGVSYLLKARQGLALEVSGGSTMYSNSRTPAHIALDVTITVPVL